MQTKFQAMAACAAAGLALAMPLSADALPRVADGGLVMTVSGEASQQFANDEAVMIFTAEVQKPEAAEAADAVSKAGNAALNALKAFGSRVDVQTADFSTWPVRTRAKEGEISEIGAWGARQTIRVTVRDLSIASDVMAAAGKTMSYDGVTFSVSRPVREAAHNALLAEAVKSAAGRAVIAAEALGLTEKNVRIEGIQVSGTAGPSPRYYAQPMLMRSAAVNEAAAPAVSAGSADATLSVSVTVRIVP